MFTIRVLLLWGHILFAIMWVGGILFVGWGVFPIIKKLSLDTQRFFLIAFMKHTHILFTLVGVLVIGTGVLLGTVFGPIASMEQMLRTMYGQKLLLAFCIGIFAIIWGIVFGYRQTMRLLQNDVIWLEAKNGHPQSLNRSFRKIMMAEAVEVGCFFVLLYMMVTF